MDWPPCGIYPAKTSKNIEKVVVVVVGGIHFHLITAMNASRAESSCAYCYFY